MFESLKGHLRVRFRLFASMIVVIFGVQGATSANALTWNLVDVVFIGGTATGSFDYDAAADTFTAINITTPTDPILTSFPGSVYTSLDRIDIASSTQLQIFDNENSTVLDLTFAMALTDRGGTIGLIAIERLGDVQRRSLSGGTVTAVNPIPLPPAVLLFGTALVGMAGINRLKQRRR